LGYLVIGSTIAKTIWGKGRATRGMVSLLNWLNRHGYSDAGVAEFLGVAKSSVSRWRTGQNKPSNEKVKALHELKSELGEKEGAPGNIPSNSQATKRPNEFGRLPSPINITMDNTPPTTRAPVTDAPEGAPEGKRGGDAEGKAAEKAKRTPSTGTIEAGLIPGGGKRTRAPSSGLRKLRKPSVNRRGGANTNGGAPNSEKPNRAGGCAPGASGVTELKHMTYETCTEPPAIEQAQQP
jgi:transcriptional regulator with XRE-family HTH domain